VGVGGAMGNCFCCVGVGPQANRCPRAETSLLPSSLMESRASFQSSVTAGGGGNRQRRKEGTVVRRSWRGSNPRHLPRKSRVSLPLPPRLWGACPLLAETKPYLGCSKRAWSGVHEARSMCPVLLRVRQRMQALQHRRPGCISANQCAWLDETYRPKLRQIGGSRRRASAFVLPHVNRPVRTIDLSEKMMSITTKTPIVVTINIIIIIQRKKNNSN
jgi:hypothetical protein